MGKTLRSVKISSVRKILDQFPEAVYLCTYQQMSLLLLDSNYKHLGSIAVMGEINIESGGTKGNPRTVSGWEAKWFDQIDNRLHLVEMLLLKMLAMLKEKGIVKSESDPHDISGEPNIPQGDGQ